jgi:DNA-binding beta-propeller fold protein YncE
VTVDGPQGLTFDPASRVVYWINEGTDSIDWAKSDGSAAGTLNTSGAHPNSAYRLALDPVAGRLYWGYTGGGPARIEYAMLNGTGVGTLDITGATEGEDVSGLAVDPAAGLIYWLNSENDLISYANLNGSGGGDLATAGAVFDEAYGLLFDPAGGRFLWGNYGRGTDKEGAIGTANLATGKPDVGGGGGAIDIATAKVDGPQDPVILKEPTGLGAPAISRDAANPATLSCPTGTWAPDYPGSFVYQAPHTYAYSWLNEVAAIPGATSSTFTATAPGTYSCAVTAVNQAGSDFQVSPGAQVTAAKLNLSAKKKAHAKPAKSASFKVAIANQGDLPTSRGAELCVTVPKKARKVLKATKCKPLTLAGLARSRATLRLKVAKKAKPGTYRVSILAKGAPANPVKARLVVNG